MSIKTWQEREPADYRLEYVDRLQGVMQAEIDELRAALNGTELFEQSFLYQKGKIEKLQSELAALKGQEPVAWFNAKRDMTYMSNFNKDDIPLFLAAGAQAKEQLKAVHQFHKAFCSDWYDGLPDQNDGRGPYETRTLYAQPVQAQKDVPETAFGNIAQERKPLTDAQRKVLEQAKEALESWERLAPDLALPEYAEAITAIQEQLK